MRLGGMADLTGGITLEQRTRIDVIKGELAGAERRAAELIDEGISSEEQLGDSPSPL